MSARLAAVRGARSSAARVVVCSAATLARRVTHALAQQLDAMSDDYSPFGDQDDLFSSAQPILGDAAPATQNSAPKRSDEFTPHAKPKTEASAPAASADSAAAPAATANSNADTGDNDVLVYVTEPCKKGDGIDAHIVYRLTTRTNLPWAKYSEFYTFRRYRDFERLRNLLVEENPGIVVPPIPDKGAFDRFGPGFERDFVEVRRIYLQRFMRRLVWHPVLKNSSHVHSFLQSPNDEWTKGDGARDARKISLIKFFKDIKTAVTGDKFHDERFDSIKSYVSGLDTHITNIARVLEKMDKQQINLANLYDDFAINSMLLGNGQRDKAMSDAWVRLGKAVAEVGKGLATCSNLSVEVMEDFVSDYHRFVHSVRRAIKQRTKAGAVYTMALNERSSKGEKYDKMRMKGARADKLQKALAEVEQADIKVKDMKSVLDEINANIQEELDRFDRLQMMDSKQMLRRYVRAFVSYHETSLEQFRSIVPEVESIDGATPIYVYDEEES